MPLRVLTISAYDRHIEELLEVVGRLTKALDAAAISYRLVGGMAVFLHVYTRSPLGARSTRDVDIAVRRSDLEEIKRAVEPYGLRHRHAAGVDMLVAADKPKANTAVHVIFVGEKVRPEYVEPVPAFSPAVKTAEGVLLAPVSDLVRMKLTSFRLRDRVHIQDMDAAGLITADTEAQLSPLLLQRLQEVRAEE